MNRQTTRLTDKQLDTLLNSNDPLNSPANFSAQVMQAIEATEVQPEISMQAPAQAQESWWQWLAILLAGVPGIAQVFTLIFSVWHVTAAG